MLYYSMENTKHYVKESISHSANRVGVVLSENLIIEKGIMKSTPESLLRVDTSQHPQTPSPVMLAKGPSSFR